MKESFDEKYARQQAVLSQLQPSALIKALAEAAAKADTDSDQVGANSLGFVRERCFVSGQAVTLGFHTPL